MIDPKTGKKTKEYVEDTYVNSKGKVVKKTTKSKQMLEVADAYDLSSGTPIENVYAAHANKLKSLALQSREASSNTKMIPYSASAKKAYQKEVDLLDAKLKVAVMNKPLERQAQIIANKVVDTKKQNNPEMSSADLKKIKGQALTEARLRVGAKKQQIDITNKEWEAIQAGAISTSKLTEILNNTDLDKVKQLATPRTATALSKAKSSKAQSMLNSGYTRAEVADALGISTSTLSKGID